MRFEVQFTWQQTRSQLSHKLRIYTLNFASATAPHVACCRLIFPLWLLLLLQLNENIQSGKLRFSIISGPFEA